MAWDDTPPSWAEAPPDEGLATSTLTPPPIISKIFGAWENAGNQFNRRVQSNVGRIAEGGNPITAGGISLLSDALKPTPDNLATLGVGGAVAEIATPVVRSAGQFVDDFLGIPFIKRKTEKFLGKAGELVQKGVGVFRQRSEDAGKVAQESFGKGLSPAIAEAESSANEAMRMAKEAQDLQGKAKEQGVLQMFQDISEKFTPDKVPLTEAGLKIQRKFADKLSGLHDMAQSFYRKVGEIMGDSPATTESSGLKFLEDLFGEKGVIGYSKVPGKPPKSPGSIQVSDFSSKLTPEQVGTMNRVMEQVKSGISPEKVAAMAPDAPLPLYQKLYDAWSSLKQGVTRSQLAEMKINVGRWAYKGDDPINTVAKQFADYLAADVSAEAKAGGYSKIAEQATSLWRNFKTLQESDLARAVKGRSGNLVHNIVAAKDASRINALTETLDKDAVNSTRRAFMDYGLEKADSDPKKIYNYLASRSDEVKKALFGSEFDLVKRLENFAKSVSESKLIPPKINKSEVLSPVEQRVADAMQSSDFSKTVANVFKDGKDVSRIEAAYKFMDEEGKIAFKRGLMNDLLNDPNKLTNADPKVLEYIFGKDKKVLEAYGELLSSKKSNLKTTMMEDAAQMISILNPPRIVRGFRGLIGKYKSGGAMRRAGQVFPEAGGGFLSAEAREGATSALGKVGVFSGSKSSNEKERKKIFGGQ